MRDLGDRVLGRRATGAGRAARGEPGVTGMAGHDGGEATSWLWLARHLALGREGSLTVSA